MPRTVRQVDAVQAAAISAFAQIVDQLVEIALDTGLTVQQICWIVKARAVRTASNRVSWESGRTSKSRVAILTGLSRSEVRKVLSTDQTGTLVRLKPRPVSRILNAWYADPRFLDHHGEPRVLSIFGKRNSFEQLVKHHGGGIPVRAMLDALLDLDSVEVIGDNKVGVKSQVPISSGLTPQAILAAGQKCYDLLGTLVKNLRGQCPPLVTASTSVEVPYSIAPVLKRELSEQAISFIKTSSLIVERSTKARGKRPSSDKSIRLGVSVHYFEDSMAQDATRITPRTRKNLRRARGPR